MKKLPWWQRLDLIRSYWPLILFVVTATAFLYTLPGRLASAEKHIEKVSNDVDDLKGWAREIQGYTKAMNQQQTSNRPVPPRVWKETGEDGREFCTNGPDAWWPNRDGACE